MFGPVAMRLQEQAAQGTRGGRQALGKQLTKHGKNMYVGGRGDTLNVKRFTTCDSCSINSCGWGFIRSASSPGAEKLGGACAWNTSSRQIHLSMIPKTPAEGISVTSKADGTDSLPARGAAIWNKTPSTS